MDDIELDRWRGEEIRSWRERWSVPELRIFRRVGSTNDVALEMAAAGAEQGTLIVAEEQTRGRGRRGREWTAAPGSSLSMSMVIRPPTPDASRVLTLRLGLAAARGVEEAFAAVLTTPAAPAKLTTTAPAGFPVAIELKWPNDLLILGRKVGGILCEAVVVDGSVRHVVAGVGLNLRRPDDGWPAAIVDRATSLADAVATGDAAGSDRELEVALELPRLVQEIVAEWLAVAGDPAESLSVRERTDFEKRDALRDRQVTVDGRAAGIAMGISPTGGLRVRHGDALGEVMAGTVRTMDSMGERA